MGGMIGREIHFFLVLSALVLIDFLAMPLARAAGGSGPDGEWAFAIVVGAFLAQFAILPAWLAWGTRPYWQRMLIHWCSAALLSAALVLGLVCTEFGSTRLRLSRIVEDIAPVILMLPLISLGVETPLWFARLVFGWRLVRPGSLLAVPKKLAIRDFLAGMSVVGIALGAARLAMSVGSATDFDFWLPWAIAVAVAAVASALTLPLMAWALLRLEDVRGGAAVVAVYGLAVYCLLAIILAILVGRANSLRPFGALFLCQASFTGVIAASFSLARRAGYRLQVG